MRHSSNSLLAASILVLLACSKSPETRLIFAVNRGDPREVEQILTHRPMPNINYRTERIGLSALTQAAATGNGEIVSLLLQHGADPNIVTRNGETPLLIASYQGNPGVVHLLLSAGARVDARESRYGFTALTTAAKEGHVEVVRLLLEAGADVNDKTDGRTALTFARQYKHPEVVRLLSRTTPAPATH